MTTIHVLTILMLLGFVVQIWALIRILKTKKTFDGYCETAKQSALIAKSVLDNTSYLQRQAEATFKEARERLEEVIDEQRRTYNLPKM